MESCLVKRFRIVSLVDLSGVKNVDGSMLFTFSDRTKKALEKEKRYLMIFLRIYVSIVVVFLTCDVYGLFLYLRIWLIARSYKLD